MAKRGGATRGNEIMPEISRTIDDYYGSGSVDRLQPQNEGCKDASPFKNVERKREKNIFPTIRINFDKTGFSSEKRKN